MITVLDCEIKNDFPQQRWNRRISKSALLKFEIVNCFTHFDKILYIDGDILVLQDINMIYSNNLDGYYAAVVKDFRVIGEKQCIDPDISYDGYFNSGAMLLNLKKMRESNVYDYIIDYRTEKRNNYMDQDAFNAGFKNHVKYLSLHCNAAISTIWRYKYETIKKIYRLKEKNIFEFYKNVILLHFSSGLKPWDYYDMPFSNIYRMLYGKYVRGKINRKSLAMINIPESYKLAYMKRALVFEKHFMNNIKVDECELSVVMPVHNAEKYIRKSIASILNQTFTYFELIIVDDASTDNSLKICRDIAMLDDRVHVFQMERNSGYGQARNEGMSRAKGKYVAFMEAGCEFQISALV